MGRKAMPQGVWGDRLEDACALGVGLDPGPDGDPVNGFAREETKRGAFSSVAVFR